MMTKIDNEEWKNSQKFESRYWNAQVKKDGEPGRPEEQLKQFKEYVEDTTDKILVDVGAGPRGILKLFDSKISIAIDPLMKEFKEQGYSFEDQKFIPVAGQGENLPLPDNYADYVFSLNALDHVQDATKSFKEMVRVLKPKGRLFLIVHLKKDDSMVDFCHKIWFGKEYIGGLVKEYRLKVINEKISDSRILTWGERIPYIGVFEK
ncbi:class I SAM-dependent methyltransferase [Candidatus Woesearchaeota archaeon]|nr:class I SAM-dependent methyltransferase [Candidatus Woesearchaeota archaeon]